MHSSRASDLILLLTAGELHAFSWRRGNLSNVGSFASDESGVAGFNRFLDASPGAGVYLIADLVEEDFRVESMAHTAGRDRKILLERKMAQYFRTVDYRSARIQGREKDGRRDDIVLFSALSNEELFSHWIQTLLERNVRVKGVLSVPLLLEIFTGFLKMESCPHLLLVNIEQHSGLRQTYLQKGLLKFSRLLSTPSFRTGRLDEIVPAECAHIRQYLERLKLLPHDQPLEIHVFVQDGMGGILAGRLKDTVLLHFQFHETGMLAAELGIDPDRMDDKGVVILSLLHALRSKNMFNAYGPTTVTRYNLLEMIRRGLLGAAALAIVISVFAGAGFLNEGLADRASLQQLQKTTLALHHKYRNLRDNQPESPIPADVMKKAVETVDKIRKQAVSPVQAMERASHAMTLCPDIRLQQFDWQSFPPDGIGNGDASEPPPDANQPPPPGGTDRAPSAKSPESEKPATVTVIEGIVYPNTGYGEAQKKVSDFISALNRAPGFTAIPVSMPTATAPDKTVKTTLDGADISGKFAVKLEFQKPSQ